MLYSIYMDTITNTPAPADFVFTHGLRYKLADALLDAGQRELLTLLQHTRPGTVLAGDHALADAARGFGLEL